MTSSVRDSHEMVCPACGADTDIFVDATQRVKLLPGGAIDRVDDIEWTDTNKVFCGKCRHDGEVQDFRDGRR